MTPTFGPLPSGRDRAGLLTPAARAEWERRRAGGRAAFIWRQGVLGFGAPAAVLSIAYKVVQEQGFAWSAALSPHLRQSIAVAAVVFPACGYLFGRWLWTTQEESYGRTMEEGKQEGE